MKKWISILAALMMLTACSNGALEENITQEAFVEEVSDEELLDKLCGTYYTEKYLETFEETKSVTDAWQYVGAMIISKSENGYAVMASDGHQGSEGMLVEGVTGESGKYIITAGNNLGESCTLTYDTENSDITTEVESNHILWKKINAVENPFVMKKIDDIENLEKDMTRQLFDGFEGVELKDNAVYAEINGTSYKLEIFADVAELGSLLSLYDGGILLISENEEPLQAFYIYENGQITIKDFEEKTIAVLKSK